MSWGEAFGRAFSHLLALLLWWFIGLLVVLFGSFLIGASFEEGFGIAVLGAIFVLGGLMIWVLTSLAVFIKAMTDAIAHHVVMRLSKRERSDIPAQVRLSP
jgi:hypothetical protein